MLREEQIDLRRQRARTGRFHIDNIGNKRVFSDYRVLNPSSGGQYTVTIRGFEIGDNICTCPDFKANTLGTCKHIEAVIESLQADLPANVKKKKAPVTRPEIYLHYGDPLRLGLHLPPRHSDKLAALAKQFFDAQGLWIDGGQFEQLIPAIEKVPEAVTVMSDALDFIDREVERDEMLRREAEWVARLDAGTFDLPLLSVPLYDYQIRGALFLACRGRSILGDDMGLGKTIQTLAAVELLARERGISRVLVVAPASVKYQWESEIRRFTSRSVQVIEGGTGNRRGQYEQPAFYKLVNYEQVVRDCDAINAWKPDVVVLDEAQRIKNWESKTSRQVKKLRSRYAMVLTGTPLENKLEELYSIVQFVDERRFGPAFQFLHDHRVLDSQGNLVGYRNLDKIRRNLEPIFLRRTRAEVLGQLPPRTDNTVYVELAAEQRGPYEEQRATLARLLRKTVLTDIDRKRVLACLVNMRLVCNSTFLFDKRTNVSPKLTEFAELVGELLNGGDHKLVVFSQWETMTAKAAEVLQSLGVGYASLDGKLSGRERKAVLDRFRTETNCRVFLSTDAGGTGLNLQAADTVINLELPWNPAVLEQRIARVHRMGQSNPVRVVNLVTRGTIEEHVQRSLQAKHNLFAEMFNGEEDEVAFHVMSQAGFLDSVRDLIGESQPAALAATSSHPTGVPSRETGESHAALWQASAQIIEALNRLLAVEGSTAEHLDPSLRTRLRMGIMELSRRLGSSD